MKQLIFVFSVAALFTLSFVFVSGAVMAEEGVESIGNPLEAGFGTNTATSGIGEGGAVGYLQERLGNLLTIMFSALAVLSLFPIVFGGIQLITSQGSTDKIEKGKKALFWGVVGLLLAFSAIVIINTLLGVILKGSAG